MKRKLVYGIIIILVLLIIAGVLIVDKYSTNMGLMKLKSVEPINCYDYSANSSGKDGISIPCSNNRECNLSDGNVILNMKAFCNPAEVGFYECGSESFCGEDGYCKQICNTS